MDRLPRLLHQNPDFTYDWLEYYGFAAADPFITPSIWLTSRLILRDGSGSTLPHELGHVLLTNRNPFVWFDNSTPFIHILYTHGVAGLIRRAATAPGPVDLVAVTDANRRTLIMHQFNNGCIEAKGNTEFVRPVLQ